MEKALKIIWNTICGKRLYYFVNMDGQGYYTDDIVAVCNEMRQDAGGDLEVSLRWMKPKDYASLPEFGGF